MGHDDGLPQRIGQRIGRYEIVRVIGHGGMGDVYVGRDTALQRNVAIKVMPAAANRDGEAARRFRDEATVVAMLDHPGIVRIHDIVEQDGAVYLIMNLVEGGSVADRLNDGRPVTASEATAIMVQLLGALEYAHGKGVVHRDVKPSNLLVSGNGEVMLSDFGVARFAGTADRTVAGTVIGTPRYMAPEQVSGEPVGPWTDIYAAGALFYELLTGRPVFEGRTTIEDIHSVLSATPAPPSRVGPPSLGTFFDAIVLRALEKRPQARWASAGEFAKAIEVADRSRAHPSALQRLASRLASWRARTPDAAPPTTLTGDLPAPWQVPADAATSPTPPPALAQAEATSTVIWKPSSSPPAAPSTTARPEADRTVMLPPSMAARPPVHLVVTASADRRLVGRTVEIKVDDFVLGRVATADCFVADDRCSRHHARIRFEGGRFTIEDLGSANGTWLDGRLLTKPRTLLFGAAIGIGETVLTFAHANDTTLPDVTGELVAGRYRLVRCLREGPKGSIYEAAPTGFGANVAVKLLSADLAAYPGYRERFEQQALAATKLQHPHVARLLDYGVAEMHAGGRVLQTPYLCYELFGGGSLSARMAQPAPIEMESARRWIAQVGEALGHAHRRGIVHGDLKPTSICLDAEGNAYVMDFVGTDAGAEAGVGVIGAPAFIAPEQWKGEPATEATDQFALGVLAYLLLSGGRPFVGQESPALRERNFQRPPRPAHEEAKANNREGVGSAASGVLQRALAVAPGERFESVGRFTAELAASLRAGQRGAKPVFISYCRGPSAGWANLIAWELKEKHQLGAYLDTEQVDGAVQFPVRLQRAIEHCEVFVCLLAEATLASPWVREEIRLAHRFNRPMIPVFQSSYVPLAPEDTEPAVESLVHFDGVHLLDDRNIHVDYTIADLVRLVKDVLERPADASPPPTAP
jgi:serine/threonine-protein kinase